MGVGKAVSWEQPSNRAWASGRLGGDGGGQARPRLPICKMLEEQSCTLEAFGESVTLPLSLRGCSMHASICVVQNKPCVLQPRLRL